MATPIFEKQCDYYAIKRTIDDKFLLVLHAKTETFGFDKLTNANIFMIKTHPTEDEANRFINSHSDSWWKEHWGVALNELKVVKLNSTITISVYDNQ